MRRRELLLQFVGAITASHPALAQQRPERVIGYLSGTAPQPFAQLVASFHDGLRQNGYVEGRNLRIEYRWADGQYDRLPVLAAELVNLKVDLIVSSGSDFASWAAKAATSTIPIVFLSGGDPVQDGLVASLSRPGGNLTGVSFLTGQLHLLRFQYLSELIPHAKVISLLVNVDTPASERMIKEVRAAAQAKAIQIHVARARSEEEIDAAFALLVRMRSDALVVQADAFFAVRRAQLVALSARYSVPAIYDVRLYAEAGGLMTYGASLTSVYRQVGIYAGKILNGANPADVPVEQPMKFELVINLKTANSLSLTIPADLLILADELID